MHKLSAPPPLARRREVATNVISLGGGVSLCKSRHQHDREGQGQAEHDFAVPDILRHGNVAVAAPVPEAGFPPHDDNEEIQAQGATMFPLKQAAPTMHRTVARPCSQMVIRLTPAT